MILIHNPIFGSFILFFAPSRRAAQLFLDTPPVRAKKPVSSKVESSHLACLGRSM